MNPRNFCTLVVPAAGKFFRPSFTSREAVATLITIGLQESQFKYRRQLLGDNRAWWQCLNGPAVSYFQFERIGIRGVLDHPASKNRITVVLSALGYPDDVETLHRALVHNDLLAAAFARLALWRLPEPLPGEDDPGEGGRQYLSIWNPGKPHPERWEANFKEAWSIVNSQPDLLPVAG